MPMLYPPIRPYLETELAVDDIHTLYIEESGNPKGIPVLVVHGGPGGGTSPEDRRFFDPEQYRIILFDQRGAGRSTPHGSVERNTTWHLIEDIEKIRSFCKIEKMMVFGGSWGSTLSILYAQRYPERIIALILRGIFFGTPKDLRWFYQAGANAIFPEAYAQFASLIPLEERGDLIKAYHKRVFGEDEIAAMAAAKAWSEWEAATAYLAPNKAVLERANQRHFAKALARIELHYFTAHCFLEPDQILRDMARIKDIPGMIVHGRYDVICPVENAIRLSEAWPLARLDIVRDAGHSAHEVGIASALVKATQEFGEQLLA